MFFIFGIKRSCHNIISSKKLIHPWDKFNLSAQESSPSSKYNILTEWRTRQFHEAASAEHYAGYVRNGIQPDRNNAFITIHSKLRCFKPLRDWKPPMSARRDPLGEWTRGFKKTVCKLAGNYAEMGGLRAIRGGIAFKINVQHQIIGGICFS